MQTPPIEALIDWKNNSVTKHIIWVIETEIDTMSKELSAGYALGDTPAETAARYSRCVGTTDGLRKLQEIIEDLNEATDDTSGRSTDSSVGKGGAGY